MLSPLARPSSIDVNTLRKDLFAPIKTEIAARGLAQQIDGIIYSADFPWKVDFSADVPAAALRQLLVDRGLKRVQPLGRADRRRQNQVKRTRPT